MSRKMWVMSSKRLLFFCGLVFFLVLGLSAPLLKGSYIYPLEIFTDNGSFYDGADMELYIEISDNGVDQVDFIFYNDSLIDSAIAEIYFDGGSLLDFAGITDGPGTLFSQFASPGNLPSGNTLESPFVTDEGFSFESEPAPPKNGVNPGEWVQITFSLTNQGSFEDVIEQLNTSALRIGTHIIALPDDSSESAVNIPEPTMIGLLGLETLVLFRRRHKA